MSRVDAVNDRGTRIVVHFDQAMDDADPTRQRGFNYTEDPRLHRVMTADGKQVEALDKNTFRVDGELYSRVPDEAAGESDAP